MARAAVGRGEGALQFPTCEVFNQVVCHIKYIHWLVVIASFGGRGDLKPKKNGKRGLGAGLPRIVVMSFSKHNSISRHKQKDKDSIVPVSN